MHFANLLDTSARTSSGAQRVLSATEYVPVCSYCVHLELHMQSKQVYIVADKWCIYCTFGSAPFLAACTHIRNPAAVTRWVRLQL